MVLAYVIAVTNLCFPRHEIYRHDYFFKPVGFAADNTDQWELAPPGTEISEMASPAKADFQGEVLFVQLADGSTWGSPDAGKELLAQRTEVEKFLKRLNDVAGDEKKFLQILGEKQPTQTSVSAVSGHLGMMEKEGGMQAVVSNVRQRLEIAQERHKLIK
jgi:hypothetical protein